MKKTIFSLAVLAALASCARTESYVPVAESADIQLTTADGEVHTVYPRLEGKARYRERNFKNFIIMPEVTIHGE